MSPDALTRATALAIPGALLIVLALWAGIRRGARELGLPPERRSALLATTGAILAGWLALAFTLGAAGAFRGVAGSAMPVVRLALALVVPIAAGLTIVARSRTARDILAATPTHLLIGVQVYRILGAIFLVLFAQGRVPGAFAHPAGWGDVLVGISAPLVAWLYRGDATRWRGLALGWSGFGLADLVVAIALGVLTAPGDAQRFALDAPNALISTFPLVLVPTVLVPVSIFLHLLTLRRLGARAGELETGARRRDVAAHAPARGL